MIACSIKTHTYGDWTDSQICSTRKLQMEKQSHIHDHQVIGHLILEFEHQIRSMTQLQLSHPMSSKMAIDPTVLFCTLLLLQGPSIIQNRVLYMEIWTTKVVGPQTFNVTRTTMETY